MKQADERDRTDDLFRAKLHDFEADACPDDWVMIASRLPRTASIPLHRQARYWVAAAVAALIVSVGGVYRMLDKEMAEVANTPAAQEIERQTQEIKSRMTESAVMAYIPAIKKDNKVDPADKAVGDDEKRSTVAEEDKEEVAAAVVSLQLPETHDNCIPQAGTAAAIPEKAKKPARKWGFGIGAGGFSAVSNNAVPNYVTHSAGLRSESLLLMNAAAFDSELPKTDIKHKHPVSFGLGVSRYLNNRFSLQTGLTYTYLSSEWNTSGKYHAHEEQKLHFLGIPVSLNYTIAEWQRFRLYASAGTMAEMNVAGSLYTQLLKEENRENVELNDEKKSTRMKEPLWSVNVTAGISYPLLRFLSAYGETGIGYYFDNGSKTETIRSKKPLNAILQFGLRLGI
ncbi:hypothetical protein Barb7_02213 [Bacteroidales bacterium Barb7]|nr:hypothetical protein Barb7_02213 [Bacteroidales bacterium Barb7]